jgi:transposase
VVNPGDIPKSSKDRHVKTDTVDCENIARHLRQGSLRCITIPDKEREQVRSLFRRRTDLVKDLRRLKSRIKSHMLYHGKEIPAEYDNIHDVPNYKQTGPQNIGSMYAVHYTC